MSFRIRRVITIPKNAPPNLDALDGPGPFGNLLAAQTYLRPIYLPKACVAVSYSYTDQGVGNYDFGIYAKVGAVFNRIHSVGTFASTGTGNILTKAINPNVRLPAGVLYLAGAYSATNLATRTVNVWPGYSIAGGPPLAATLAAALDNTSNFPSTLGLVIA